MLTGLLAQVCHQKLFYNIASISLLSSRLTCRVCPLLFFLALHGGSIAAAIHHAAVTHLTTDPTLAPRNQPDIQSMHLQFLRACEQRNSTITIEPMRIGAAASTLQLKVSQDGKLRVLALAVSANFDIELGPTVPTAWSLHPPPSPKPDFDRVLARKPDENWIPGLLDGELIPLTRRKLGLHPRAGFPVDGVCDSWHGFLADERMDATYLALMADIIPSLSDTLMRNGGVFDVRTLQKKMEEGARKHPGEPCMMSNSIAEAMKATHHNSTLTLDIHYKRRLPKEGLGFLFTRAAAKMLQGGRMDVDITLCDENMELVATAHQQILVLDAQKKFRARKEKSSL